MDARIDGGGTYKQVVFHFLGLNTHVLREISLAKKGIKGIDVEMENS